MVPPLTDDNAADGKIGSADTMVSDWMEHYYKYVNGKSIKHSVKPTLGMKQNNNPKIQYTIDFDVTPHLLRHTYITNDTRTAKQLWTSMRR